MSRDVTRVWLSNEDEDAGDVMWCDVTLTHQHQDRTPLRRATVLDTKLFVNYGFKNTLLSRQVARRPKTQVNGQTIRCYMLIQPSERALVQTASMNTSAMQANERKNSARKLTVEIRSYEWNIYFAGIYGVATIKTRASSAPNLRIT